MSFPSCSCLRCGPGLIFSFFIFALSSRILSLTLMAKATLGGPCFMLRAEISKSLVFSMMPELISWTFMLILMLPVMIFSCSIAFLVPLGP